MSAANNTGKVLLMGNPNVGKSVFFTQLTGIHAISSNYAGTTVSYMEGKLKLCESFENADREFILTDVPGTYSLKPVSEAETVAARFLGDGADAVVCVLDASNLERNLHLALDLRQYDIPVIYVLNLIDVAARRGINIKAKLLSDELGAPVIPTVAVKKQGLDQLKKQLETILYGKETQKGVEPTERSSVVSCENCVSCPSKSDCDLWSTAREITGRVSCKEGLGRSFLDKLGDIMMKPFPGLPIAILITALLIGFLVGAGETLRKYLLEPLVEHIIVPFFEKLFSSFISEGVLLNILVGEYGIFVISFEWILAAILPYVFLFYAAFSFLEDSGYLPRISVLFDNIMRKIGVQGGSLIYAMMGFGCAVPAIIGTRAATSRKERIVISTAVCFAIPCISQTGALISLLSGYAWWMFPVMLLFMLFIFVITALIAGKIVKGKVDPLLIELPHLLIPEPKAYAKKLTARMKHFLLEAEFPMMVAIVIAATLKETGAIDKISDFAAPLMSHWLGLPAEAVEGLLLGIIRREMSVMPLLALDLTAFQAFTGGVVSLLYLPCMAVFGTLVKEFGLKISVAISVSTIVIALTVGGVINQLGQFINLHGFFY
ncbi:MAG: ferrous iron transport protein B [Oscillospiraceae bacterium]|nr:ferrous iron transport protein B [Oscillospiraceae bacterium]